MARIDLHVHYLAPEYRKALLDAGELLPDGFPTPHWDAEEHVRMMDRQGISIALLSASSPHINFGNREGAKALARNVNEYGAEVARRYPGRFGLLASLPLPDVEDSIQEIRHALDVLHADGFALPTNTRGVYLGDPRLDPIFEELNTRKAVAVLHPNKPGSVPCGVAEELPVPFMEFFFDTTRTAINLLMKGVLVRFPEIRFVIPHAGAFLPILVDRVNMYFQVMSTVGLDVYSQFKKFYFDVAGMCLPRQLADLIQLVDVGHLLYGSDYPYTPEPVVKLLADALDKTHLFTTEERQAIYSQNALSLFPHVG
jgi:predicted TIM-barrel fold metal-dependent hydrolase